MRQVNPYAHDSNTDHAPSSCAENPFEQVSRLERLPGKFLWVCIGLADWMVVSVLLAPLIGVYGATVTKGTWVTEGFFNDGDNAGCGRWSCLFCGCSRGAPGRRGGGVLTGVLTVAGATSVFVAAGLLGVPRLKAAFSFGASGLFLLGVADIVYGALWMAAFWFLLASGAAFVLFLVFQRARMLSGRPVLWIAVPPQESDDPFAGRPRVPGVVVEGDVEGREQ